MDGGSAEGEQGRVDASTEDVEDVADARRAARCQPPQAGAADHHRASAEGERLDYVTAAANTAIEQDLGLAADGRHHGWQCPDRGGGAVQVVAAVVGYRDRGRARVDRA